MNLGEKIREWLDEIGADGLMLDGHFIDKLHFQDDVMDWDGYALVQFVPAFRHADGSFHVEPEWLEKCGGCDFMGICEDMDSFKQAREDCPELQSWLAHKGEAK